MNSLLKTDLIDTLWNVKEAVVAPLPFVTDDLIDTLWNVKYVICHATDFVKDGFNRYIVECKGYC